MNLTQFKKFCRTNKLVLTRTSANKKKRSNGIYYLVADKDGKEVDFFKIEPKCLPNSKERIEQKLQAGEDIPQGEWSAIDPVKEFQQWVDCLATMQVKFPLEKALELTKALDQRDLFSKASILGYSSTFKDGKVSFIKREQPPRLPLNNLS